MREKVYEVAASLRRSRLAPALNIQRSPLCGRNFEYALYSFILDWPGRNRYNNGQGDLKSHTNTKGGFVSDSFGASGINKGISMKLSLMTFSMMRDGISKTIDADLLARIIHESGYEEADLMEFEFRIYGKEKLLAALKKYGVKVSCIISAPPFFTAPQAVEQSIKASLMLCKEAGTDMLMLVPGQSSPLRIGPDEREICASMSRDEMLMRTVEMYRLAVSLAEDTGVQVVFENTPHWYKPLAAPQDVKYVLDRVPGLGLVFDTGNFRVADTECNELEAYDLLKDRIRRVHLKDVRIGDFPEGEQCVSGQSIKAVLSGSGVIPMQELLVRMDNDGYQGIYSVEYAAPSDVHGCAHIDAASVYGKILRRMADRSLTLCPKTAFPGLDKKVSRIFFGTASMPFMMGMGTEQLLDQMVSSGINAIDTARGYGQAEAAVGRWLAARKNREEVVILSKCGNVSPDGKVLVNREVILKEISESLSALQTDYIDIYLLHRDDPKTPVSELIDTLNELADAGKIRVFGVSNWTDERIREANDYAASKGLRGFTVSSPNYGLARQVTDPWGGGCVTVSGPENREARAWYTENQMPLIAYSSLGRGFFSGRFRSFDDEGAKKVLDPFAAKGYLSEDNMRRLAAAEVYASAHDISVPQTAMRFILSSPMNVFAAASMSSFTRMQENTEAAAERMSAADWEKFDNIS